MNWSIPGRSIFLRKRPLAPATLRRIETGLRKFGGRGAEPFLVVLRNHSTARRLEDPAPTVTTSGAHLALCEPFLLGQQSGAAAREVGEPAPTVATGGAISLIVPAFLFANRTNNIPKRMEQPVPTVCTANHMALVEPQWNGEGGDRRLPTVTVDGRRCRLGHPVPDAGARGAGRSAGLRDRARVPGNADRAGPPDRKRGAGRHRARAVRGTPGMRRRDEAEAVAACREVIDGASGRKRKLAESATADGRMPAGDKAGGPSSPAPSNG